MFVAALLAALRRWPALGALADRALRALGPSRRRVLARVPTRRR